MIQLILSPFNGHILTKGKQSSRFSEDDSVQVTILTPNGYFSVPVFLEEDSDGRSVWKDEPDFDDMTDFGYLNYKKNRDKSRRVWSPPGYGDDD